MHVPDLNALSIDCVIFGFDGKSLNILLIKRALDPKKGMWALPGGFVRPEEDLDTSAKRILKDLTGIDNLFMDQLYTFGAVKRYPLARVISIAYYSLINLNAYKIASNDNVQDAQWFSVHTQPELVFDHAEMVQKGLDKLKTTSKQEPIGFELLPEKFTLSELQHLYEAIMNAQFDKRNFRKKILGLDILIKTTELQQGVAHRAAYFYRFDPEKYEFMKNQGVLFEF